MFLYWRGFQARPDACKFTEARRKLVNRALADYDDRDLCALVLYAYRADEPGPRFWRGDNRDSRTYLDLVNLLSEAARLPGRVEAATAWLDACQRAPDVGVAVEDDPTAMLAALARRAPGESVAVTLAKASPATTAVPDGRASGAAARRRVRLRWE